MSRCDPIAFSNLVMVDGHCESWKYPDLKLNKNDVFALNDLFLQP